MTKYDIRSFIKFNTSGRTSYYPLNRANKILAKERLIVAAGGINHEMYLAERIADGIWNGNLRGSLPIGAYMWARISPMLYSFNSSGSSGHDINNIEKFAKELGVNISKSKLQTAYTISLLGGTIYSMICHLSSHNNDIEPVTFNNFRIPDIFPYVTSYGVSYKFVSGYKMNDIVSFNLGYERVFHGKRKHEFSLGINSKLDILDFGANIYFGCVGLGIDAIAAIKVTEKISLNLRLASYATRGLMGERHAKSYFKSRGVNDKESTRNNMISLGVSYWYGH